MSKSIGSRLRFLRVSHQLSFAQLSERAGIGTLRLRALEAGLWKPSLKDLMSLAIAYEIPLAAFRRERGLSALEAMPADLTREIREPARVAPRRICGDEHFDLMAEDGGAYAYACELLAGVRARAARTRA